MKIIYADNNATTQTAPEVYEAMIPYFTENYFNPSSMYDAARGAAQAIAGARKGIARCLGGVDPKEIDVSMDDGVLTIKGKREIDDVEERDNYKRIERYYGSFHRRFSLPDTANAEGISAEVRDGVLNVEIPKLEKVQPRRIEVKH